MDGRRTQFCRALIGFLVNPKDPNAQPDVKDAHIAAEAVNRQLIVGEASTESELDSTFRNFSQQRVAAVFVDAEPFLLDQHKRIIALAQRSGMPIVSQFRSFAADGALASYGTSLTEANRQLGLYAGRVL
jgi:putative tryptophan/tyrosine transport system substrate-binding protein